MSRTRKTDEPVEGKTVIISAINIGIALTCLYIAWIDMNTVQFLLRNDRAMGIMGLFGLLCFYSLGIINILRAYYQLKYRKTSLENEYLWIIGSVIFFILTFVILRTSIYFIN